MKIIILLFLLFLLILFFKRTNVISNFKNKKRKNKQKEERFKKCLESMKKILDDENQEFFLCCGTLLGCVRNKKFIEYDKDIDIGIFSNKFNSNLKNIILRSGKFKLKHELGNINNSYELSFIHKKTKVSIDIFLHYPLERNFYYCASFFGLCNKKPYGFCRWKYPINKLEKCRFYNKIYLIPSNKEEYLYYAYGKNWRIPKNFSYFEGINGKYKNLMD